MQFTEEQIVTSGTQLLYTIDSPYYNPNLDILGVYVNGERKYPGTDYMQSGKMITFTDFLSVDDVIFFEILKSVDTEDAETVAVFAQYFAAQIRSINERLGGLSFRKLSKAAYDALPIKDPDTVYFVEDSGTISMYVGTIPVAGGGSGGTVQPVVQMAWSQPAVRATKLANLNFSPAGSWKCDPEWYYEGTRDASIGGRGYTKQSALPAIGFVCQVNVGGIYSTLMLISDDPDAVSNGAAGAANTSFSYDGITWYATNYNYSQGGQYDDALGNYPTFPEVLAFDSTTNTLTPQAIQTVLEYVNAAAT